MHEMFADLLKRAGSWFERCRAARLLDERDEKLLERVEQRTPADLFGANGARPLVVAFFGGTGVGKSSLLNRLVGRPIARTGVERPTSRELTMYVHRSVELAELPPELPLDHVRIERHDDASRRNVAWLDAPDIDSTEADNRTAALAWLPHIDLIAYVVSPERYRDDAGWRVLLERRGRHGWMFVINRWDEGSSEQKDDLTNMLRAAGFDTPFVLCTSCAVQSGAAPSADEFELMEEAIRVVIEQHGVRELARLGYRARLLELRGALEAASRRLGDDEDWHAVRDASQEAWMHTRRTILEGVEWPIRTAAGRLAARESGLGGRIKRGLRAAKGEAVAGSHSQADRKEALGDRATADASELAYLTQSIWDDWTQSKLGALVDAVELAAGRRELCTTSLRRNLDEAARSARPSVLDVMQSNVRAAMAAPGTALQRGLRRVTGFLTVSLPAVALAWVAYALVTRYYRATVGAFEFPGSNFAISSAMLVLVAWGLPFVIDRLLRPSLEKTLARALRQGVELALDDLAVRVEDAVEAAANLAAEHRSQAESLVQEIARTVLLPGGKIAPDLSRLLVRPGALQRR